MAMKKAAAQPEEDFELFRERMLMLALRDAPEKTAVAPAAEPEVASSIKLYYTNPSVNSDKVYHISIVKEPKFKDTWYVNFSYGKRGKTLKDGTKTKIAVNYIEACRIFDSVVKEKRDEGYTTNVNGKPYSEFDFRRSPS
jgi:hypothetical protein